VIDVREMLRMKIKGRKVLPPYRRTKRLRQSLRLRRRTGGQCLRCRKLTAAREIPSCPCRGSWAQDQDHCIDAGHGGKDPGAIGKSGLKEKSITLDVAKRLAVLVKERLAARSS